ncbi:MAG: DMT family transporter [Burkholderiales bacterium]|nr:DMT family transporter [Burkholderiales bacterium]
MTGALVLFTGMAVAARELSADLGTFQLLALRSLIGLAIVSALLQKSGWSQLGTAHLKLHALRNLAHYGGQFGWFHAIAAIPLATVFAIEFTVPVWTAVFAALLLGERITAPRVIAIACGLAGVLVILRPGAAIVHPAALVMLAGAISFGLAHTMTKKLTAHEPMLAILFWMSALQLPLGLVPALFQWAPLEARHAPWLLLVGCAGLAAHWCMVRALALADATVVVTLDFLRLPLITLIGFWVYHEPADWYLAIGAALILAANLVNVFARQPAPGNAQSAGTTTAG